MTTSAAPDHHLRKTFFFLAFAVVANSFGNLLLALGMDRVPDFYKVAFGRYLLALVDNPYLIPGTILLAAYTFAQVSLFSWADLSFVIPCISSTYIFSTLLAEFVLGEPVLLLRWIGVVLISVGVALVASTPVTTRARSPQEIL